MAMSLKTAHRVIVGLYCTGLAIGVLALLLVARHWYVTVQFYDDMINKDPLMKARYEELQKVKRDHWKKVFWL
jgi:hypothetical protein